MNLRQQFREYFILRDSFPTWLMVLWLVGAPTFQFAWKLLRSGTFSDAVEAAALMLFFAAMFFGIFEAVIRYKNRPISTK